MSDGIEFKFGLVCVRRVKLHNEKLEELRVTACVVQSLKNSAAEII